MSLQLEPEDFKRLSQILCTIQGFQLPQNRAVFISDVVAGAHQKDKVLSTINLSGHPKSAAVRAIDYLQTFGQDSRGQETLGLLINKILAYRGESEDADFLRGLLAQYPLGSLPTAVGTSPPNWRGVYSSEDVHEKIIGENTLRDIYTLELAIEASKTVVRIRTPTSVGTGFLMGKNLIMTNNHVIAERRVAAASEFFFNYQIDRYGNEVPFHICKPKIGGVFHTNAELDFTVVEIEDAPLSITPLRLSDKRLFPNDRVSIVQHPGGHYKKVSTQNNFVMYADCEVIQYLTATLPGASGAPVFDSAFEVVGVHHSGGNLCEPNSNIISMRNAGTSAIAIIAELETNLPLELEHQGVEL